MLTKAIIFIISLIAGSFLMVKREYIVREIGHNATAEKYLGGGGSYLMWSLIGLLIIILGFLYLIGDLDPVIDVLNV